MKYFICICIFLLNMFDGFATDVGVSVGAKELNPIVAGAMDVLGVWWLFWKVLFGLIAAVVIFIYWGKTKAAKIGGIFVFAAYSLLAAWHIFLFTFLL